MDKRTLAKVAAKLIVGTAAGNFITKTLQANAPATQNFKVAEMTGTLGGFVVSEKLEPHTNKLVDDLFNKYETKK